MSLWRGFWTLSPKVIVAFFFGLKPVLSRSFQYFALPAESSMVSRWNWRSPTLARLARGALRNYIFTIFANSTFVIIFTMHWFLTPRIDINTRFTTPPPYLQTSRLNKNFWTASNVCDLCGLSCHLIQSPGAWTEQLLPAGKDVSRTLFPAQYTRVCSAFFNKNTRTMASCYWHLHFLGFVVSWFSHARSD